VRRSSCLAGGVRPRRVRLCAFFRAIQKSVSDAVPAGGECVVLVRTRSPPGPGDLKWAAQANGLGEAHGLKAASGIVSRGCSDDGGSDGSGTYRAVVGSECPQPGTERARSERRQYTSARHASSFPQRLERSGVVAAADPHHRPLPGPPPQPRPRSSMVLTHRLEMVMAVARMSPSAQRSPSPVEAGKQGQRP
jgi:hypothetical protein